MPQPKVTKVNNRKLSQIPIIIENKENNSTPTQSRRREQPVVGLFLQILGQTSMKRHNNHRTTTITGVSSRRSTLEHDPIEQTRSAPSSPALYHRAKPRSYHNQISLDPISNVCFSKILILKIS